ncbi:hypothetical protein JCM6882_002323 [Rhodosporidiobolus microsporus]
MGEETKPSPSTVAAAIAAVPSRPTPLPVDSHLRGSDNYDIWAIQMRALVSSDTYAVLTGSYPRPADAAAAAVWDRMNEFAVSSIIISCHSSVIHHVATCEHSASAYWKALQDVFRPTDAQGALRLLTRYWSLSLLTASPEAFNSFAKEYKATLASLKAANVDLEVIYSSHLLAALPSSLASLQTTLAVTNQGTLPRTDTIFEVVRNEILRTSSTAPGVALLAAAASKDDSPPPSPCPACSAMHWLRACPKRDEYRKRRRAAAKLATAQSPSERPATPPAPPAPAAALAECDGVEAWLSTLNLTTPAPSRTATLDSGATHSMVGDASLFANLRRCTPSPVGGLSGKNGLRVIGVGSIFIRLATGCLVTLDNALCVPGISANLISASQLYDLHGVTCSFGKGATLVKARSLPPVLGVTNNLYRLDGELVEPSPRASALLATNRAGAELTTWHRRFAHLSVRSSLLVQHLPRRPLVAPPVPLVRETPPPYSPQSNGVAERVNRSIVEGVIALLSQSGAPKELWAEALQAFVFTKNRSPHAALASGVPLSVWRRRPVCVDMLRVWGCRAWHTVTNGDSTAYRLYDPVGGKIVRSRDARFVEDEFPLLTTASPPYTTGGSIEPTELAIAPAVANPLAAAPTTPAVHPAVAPAAPPRPRHSSAAPVTPAPQLSFARAVAPSPPPVAAPVPDSPDPLDLLSDPFAATLGEVEGLMAAVGDELGATDDDFTLPSSDPRNHKEAARDVDSERWQLGADEEFRSLRDDFNVFHPVKRLSLPPGAKLLGCRFVYRRKKDEHGRVTGYKVRLVAQGFSQRPGVDFRETFAPVAKFTSIRVLLALAACQAMHVQQADVDKAYLHGELDEELYMRVPAGLDAPGLDGKVLKLERALYGLKQAGRVWNHRIHASLEQLGYVCTASDACIYVQSEGGRHHYIALYVDDLLFVSPSLDEIARVKGGPKAEYGIKDLGDAKFILGIQVHRRSNGGIFLSQCAYLDDVLLRLGQAGTKSALTPMIPNLQLRAAPLDYTPEPAFRRRYMQAVGSLMYAMLGTRPDLTHAVGVLGRHAARPNESHWAAVVRVCQYIKGTLDYGIEYSPDDSPLVGFEAYSDSDWGACVDTARSTMGYAFLLASGAVAWSSKLQPRVAASSTEAEYLGLSHASKEAIFLSQLLGELGVGAPGPATLFGDNQGANALSRDPQFHDRTRHLRLTEHFVREMVQQGVVAVEYIPTAHMVADTMTKSLPLPAFLTHRAGMGVKALRARGGVAANALPPFPDSAPQPSGDRGD